MEHGPWNMPMNVFLPCWLSPEEPCPYLFYLQDLQVSSFLKTIQDHIRSCDASDANISNLSFVWRLGVLGGGVTR